MYDFRVSQGTRSVGLEIHMKEASVLGLQDMQFDAARYAKANLGRWQNREVECVGVGWWVWFGE